MSEGNKRISIKDTFDDCASKGKTAFVAFITCGYKRISDTVPILLALQQGGSDIIELGVPFSDPQADGPTIQMAHQVGVDQGIALRDVMDVIKEARDKGLKVPVILMGYLNNFLAYGIENSCKDLKDAGGDGFIIVDLPPEEASREIVPLIDYYGLNFIPLISPTTTEDRMALIAKVARGFVYCVSLTGVTGARTDLPPGLDTFMTTVRRHISLPLALGFGLSTREHVDAASNIADAAVIGSKIIKLIGEGSDDISSICQRVQSFCEEITL